MRIVLDTAVLVRALRSDTGAAAQVVRLAALGRFLLLMDFKLVCEYRDVALRPSHLLASGKTPSEVEAVIDLLESVATPVEVRFRYRPLSRDPNDDMLMDLAIHGGADAVVTNNIKDFLTAGTDFGIQVWTPKEFLNELRWRDSDDSGERKKGRTQ